MIVEPKEKQLVQYQASLQKMEKELDTKNRFLTDCSELVLGLKLKLDESERTN